MVRKCRLKRGDAYMRRKLSGIGVMFVVILTTMLGFFAQPAGAIGMDDYSVYVESGKPYNYYPNESNKYLKFNVYAEGTLRFRALTEALDSYAADTRYYVYDNNGREVKYMNEYNQQTKIASLDRTLTLAAGTYYFYQRPYSDKSWGGKNAYVASRVIIDYPTPAASPRITKISTGNKKAWVYWNKIPNATSYRVYVEQNGIRREFRTTQTKFLVTGMTNGVKANYYVKAVVGKLTTQKNTAYSTPRNGVKPKLTVTSGKCHIAWNKYTGATQYKVVMVDENNRILAERVTKGTAFDWNGLKKGMKRGFYIVPYVNGDYIPFGRSYAEDKANIVHFTAK